MNVDSMQHLSDVWREVRDWPARQRLALATRILQSLEQEQRPPTVSTERQRALARLIGAWKADHSPTDEEVQQIIEKEKMKKYG